MIEETGFVGENRLTFIDGKVAADSFPDWTIDKNDWAAKNWIVRLGGHTKEAYFIANTPKQVRRFFPDIHPKIEGVYHRFVRDSRSCIISDGKTQNIPNYFKPIHYGGRQWEDNKGRPRLVQTGTISTKDRPDWANGSCVLLKARDDYGLAKDATQYITYYIGY